MSISVLVFNRILLMLIIVLCGMICYKAKFITVSGNKELTNLLLMIVNPLIIMMSFQRDYETELIRGLVVSFILATLSYVVTIPLLNLLIPKSSPEYRVERFAVIYQNCGFFGIPLITAIYGSEGVFYLSAYMAVFNVFCWTHGVLLMAASDGSRMAPAQVIRSILNPATVASIIGILLFVLQIRLPAQVADACNMLGSMNTPLAMIIAGVTLAQTDLTRIFFQPRIYFCAALRLLAVPILTMAVLHFVPLNDMLKVICVLVSGCPTAAATTMFALRYDRNAVYGAELFAFTTVVSAVTLPLMMVLYQWMG